MLHPYGIYRQIWLIIVLLLISASPLVAQAYNASNPCQEVPTDKKRGYYQRNVGRAEKAGDAQSAAIFGCYQLALAKSKKQKQKAGEALLQVLPAAIGVSPRIRFLDSASRYVVGEKSLLERTNLRCEYGKYAQLASAYQNIPEDLLDPAIAKVFADYNPYEEKYRTAGDSIASASKQVAEYYYRQALKVEANHDVRANALRTVKYVDRGLTFDARHEGLDSLHRLLSPKAIGFVKLTDVSIASGGAGAREVVSELYRSAVRKQLSNSPYFVTTAEPTHNLAVRLSVTDIETEQKRSEPATKIRETTIDEVTVKAKIISHSKETVAQVTGSYTIVDVQTGKELATRGINATGMHIQTWYTYTGNKKALKKRDIRRLKPEPQWASPQLAKTDGLRTFGSNSGERAGKFLVGRGSVTPIQVFDREIIANTYTKKK